MIREAQRLRPDAASRWLVAGAPTLPFPDGGFDVVTLAFIFNHVPSPESTLRDCARVLRPGGVLAIAVWGDSGLVEAWDAVLGVPGAVRLPTPQLPPEEDFARTAEGLAELCGRAGLRVLGRSQPAWTVRISVDELWQAPLAGLARIGRQVAAQTPAVQAAMLQRCGRMPSVPGRRSSSPFARPPRSCSPAPAADRVVGAADP
ncbi:class I SAM-dependent methyltransferase [Tessaracoccus flavescens]|nr:class I SAM-dependent methyltransferase [Tessaracoccus flavescens]